MSKIDEQNARIDSLEAQVAMLESHVDHLCTCYESQEQYSRRLCLRIDRVPLPLKGTKETADQVLDKVKKLFEEMEVDFPENVIDRAHRIGGIKSSDGMPSSQAIIVRLTTWHHRTMVYQARKKAKVAKFRLDLTKARLDLLIAAQELLKPHPNCFAFADINCRLRVCSNNKLHLFDKLKRIVEG